MQQCRPAALQMRAFCHRGVDTIHAGWWYKVQLNAFLRIISLESCSWSRGCWGYTVTNARCVCYIRIIIVRTYKTRTAVAAYPCKTHVLYCNRSLVVLSYVQYQWLRKILFCWIEFPKPYEAAVTCVCFSPHHRRAPYRSRGVNFELLN